MILCVCHTENGAKRNLHILAIFLYRRRRSLLHPSRIKLLGKMSESESQKISPSNKIDNVCFCFLFEHFLLFIIRCKTIKSAESLCGRILSFPSDLKCGRMPKIWINVCILQFFILEMFAFLFWWCVWNVCAIRCKC